MRSAWRRKTTLGMAALPMALLPSMCVPSVQSQPGSDSVTYSGGEKTAESRQHISILFNGAQVTERRWDALIDLGYRRAQVRGRIVNTLTNPNHVFTVSDHYMQCEYGGYVCGGVAFLRQTTSYQSPFWWQPFRDARILDGSVFRHVSFACSQGADPDCANAVNSTRYIACTSSQGGLCFFGNVPGGASVSTDDDGDKVEVVANTSDADTEHRVVGSAAPEILAADRVTFEEATAPFDWSTDPWARGDIDLVLRNTPIGADAWFEDGRLNHDRLASYGYRLDPDRWITPIDG